MKGKAMVNHKVIIVKKTDVSDLETLKKHPKVIKYIETPYDYVFFEYYDDALFKSWNGSPEVKYNPEIIAEVNKIEMVIQDLLSPLYSNVDDEKNIFMTGMQIFIDDTLYDRPTVKRLRYLNLKYNNTKSTPLHGLILSVKFKKLNDKYKAGYEKILDEWIVWAKEKYYLKSCSSIEYIEEHVCKVIIDFNSNVDICILALYMMLNEMRSKSSIDYICFN